MKNTYSISEIIKNIFALLFTKLFYPRARLIRLPIYMRGKKHLSYGNGFSTGYCCRIEMFNQDKNINLIKIGQNCKLGDYVHISACEKVVIGNNCLMASHIFISDNSHGVYSGDGVHSSPDSEPDKRPLFSKPLIIGDNVWIGENVCILSGVKIGNGCIIGANSIVNKDIPDHCIVAGVPAKIIKIYDRMHSQWMSVKKD